jgi:hypothetical protein
VLLFIDRPKETTAAPINRGRKQSGAHLPSAKTAAELGIVCFGGDTGTQCGKSVIWFDYEIGEWDHKSDFVCDEHKISTRLEKFAQPTAASMV